MVGFIHVLALAFSKPEKRQMNKYIRAFKKLLSWFPALCTLIIDGRDLYKCLCPDTYSVTQGNDPMLVHVPILALSSLYWLHSVVSFHKRQARISQRISALGSLHFLCNLWETDGFPCHSNQSP